VNVFACCEAGGQTPKNATTRVRQYLPVRDYAGAEVAIDLASLSAHMNVLWLRVWVETPRGWGVQWVDFLNRSESRCRPLLSIPTLHLPKLEHATESLPTRRVVLVRFAPVVGWFSV
jgi:hypothetical protein